MKGLELSFNLVMVICFLIYRTSQYYTTSQYSTTASRPNSTVSNVRINDARILRPSAAQVPAPAIPRGWGTQPIGEPICHKLQDALTQNFYFFDIFGSGPDSITSYIVALLLIVEHCYSRTKFPFLSGPSVLLADSFMKLLSVSPLTEALRASSCMSAKSCP